MILHCFYKYKQSEKCLAYPVTLIFALEAIMN